LSTGIAKKEIKAGLVELGTKEGDVLLVHSSLSSFGKVDGGADTVIDALLEVITESGTLCMPTNTYSFAKEHVEGHLNPPYHPLRTASKIGVMPEFFRFRPGAKRSLHPTHSVCVLGKDLDQILKNNKPTDSPFGLNSPFKKMFDLDAKVLFLGCGLKANSTVHAVEDWAGVPVSEAEEALLVDEANHTAKVTVPSIPIGDRDFYHTESNLNKKLVESGLMRGIQIGQALVQMMKMRDIVKVMLTFLKIDPAIVLCDRPNCEFCSGRKKLVLQEKEKILKNMDSFGFIKS